VTAMSMYVPPAAMDPVERATTYPYHIPDHAFVFEHGRWHAADDERIAGLTRGRAPVIACGSNRSPEQLARKYADFEHVVIPVERAWVDDFDVVFAAHITGYGSIAANLQHVPGARVEVSITWLSDELMERMHATEGRGASYDYARIEGLTLRTEHGETRDTAFAYVYRHGSLNVAGDHAGLHEIAAENRPHRSLRQREAIAHVQARIGRACALEDFIHETVADAGLRHERETLLQEDAIAFRWSRWSVVA
jgi:hypothetical protein